MDETHMQHGRHWDGQDVAGWMASEKYNGCRAYWDGQTLWSRSGRPIALPVKVAAQLPLMPLDGEIYGGPTKAGFAAAAALVKRDRWADGLRFMVFDRPGLDLPWEGRLTCAASALRGGFAKAVGHIRVRDMAHLRELFQGVKARGGEGLMVMNPEVRHYHRCRTADLLKVKRYPGTVFHRLAALLAA